MKKKLSTERTSDKYLVLNNCGIQQFFDIDGHCLRENGRVDYHILYISEGACHLKKDNKEMKIPKGNIILFRPNERQDYSFNKQDKAISYYIHFTGTGCEALLKELELYNETVIEIQKNRNFEETFKSMLYEYNLKQHAYESYCSAKLLELFSIISRYAWIKKNNIGTRNEKIVFNAKQTIYENLTDITIDELATQAFLSVGRFSHIFKEITGKPPYEYITLMRIQKAKDMLMNTDFPISRIAADAGYSDQNYFSRIFKKTTGMSPSEFIRTN